MINGKSKKNKVLNAIVFGAGLILLTCIALWFVAPPVVGAIINYQDEAKKKNLIQKIQDGKATTEEKWLFVNEPDTLSVSYHSSIDSEQLVLMEKYLDELVSDNYHEALVLKSQHMLFGIDDFANAKEETMLSSLGYLQTAIQQNCKTEYRYNPYPYKPLIHGNYTDYIYDNIRTTNKLLGEDSTASVRRQYGLLTIYHYSQCVDKKQARAFVIDKLATPKASLFSKAQSHLIADMNNDKEMIKVIDTFIESEDKALFEQKIEWLEVNFQKTFVQ